MEFGTYSFADIFVTIAGGGGVVQLGYGSGAAEEGLTFEPIDERTKMTIGADGSGMHSLIQSRAARMIVRLLKTSPANAQLHGMFTTQSASSLLWGQNLVTLTNAVSGDQYSAAGTAFTKEPPNLWAKEANIIEWEFMAIRAFTLMGSQVPTSLL